MMLLNHRLGVSCQICWRNLTLILVTAFGSYYLWKRYGEARLRRRLLMAKLKQISKMARKTADELESWSKQKVVVERARIRDSVLGDRSRIT